MTVTLDDGGVAYAAEAGDPRAVLLLGHGASGKIDGRDLVALAEGLPVRGITVVRHLQPWRAAGGRMTPRPPVLDEGWASAVAWVGQRYAGLPLVVGGHSAGARCACRGSARPDLRAQAGVVALSFPLHPPGQPEKSRLPELLGVPGPLLVVQGERDPFGGTAELREAVPDGWFAGSRSILTMPMAGHDLVPLKRTMPTEEAMALVVDAVAGFVDGLIPRR